MRTIRFYFLVILMILGLNAWARCDLRAATYHGRVVDAESGEPLEGALVMIQWHKKPIVTMDGPEYFHNIREAITKAEGEFSINASSGPDWNPLTYVLERASLVVFKVGFRPFSTSFKPGSDFHNELVKGTTLHLTKLKSKENLRKFTTPGRLNVRLCTFLDPAGSCVSEGRVPNLIRMLKIQRKLLGLKPLG